MSSTLPSPVSFYDRGPGGLSREEIVAGEKNNRRQEEKILEFVRLRPSSPVTAEIIVEYLPGILLTSARRSLTNLSDRNLIRFAGKVPGANGVRINSYLPILADQSHHQLALL